MATVNRHDAKTDPSKLGEPAAAGEEIAIAKAGRPLPRPMQFARRTGPPPLPVARSSRAMTPRGKRQHFSRLP